jgi:hypothetical protein
MVMDARDEGVEGDEGRGGEGGRGEGLRARARAFFYHAGRACDCTIVLRSLQLAKKKIPRKCYAHLFHALLPPYLPPYLPHSPTSSPTFLQTLHQYLTIYLI